MNTKTTWIALLSVAGMAALSCTAAAQIVSAKEFGSGTLTLQSGSQEHLDYVRVRLNSDHTFVIQAYRKTENSERGISGKWRVSGPHNYALTITGYEAQKATGSGSLRTTPDEQDFSRLSLSGNGAAGNFSLSFASSVAQKLGSKFSLSRTEHGTGTLNFGSSRYDIRTAFVRINPNGTCEVRLLGDRELDVRGTWDNADGNDRIHLTFNQDAAGNAASGNGSVVLRSNRRGVSTIQVDGTDVGQSFAAHFTAVDSGGTIGSQGSAGKIFHSLGSKRPFAEVDSTQLGDGSYILGNNNSHMTEARVIIMPDARCEIIVYGDTQRTFTGTWKNMSGNEVQIKITGGYHHATGSGNVVLDSTRKKFTTVNLNGQLDGLSFSVYFNANR